MANYENQPRYGGTIARGAEGAIDEGLRAHMLRVYNYMVVGLVITGLTAYGTFTLAFQEVGGQLAYTALGQTLFGSPLMWVVILAPLALVFFLSFRIDKMSVGAAQATFWIYAALLGVSLSILFAAYTAASITQVFFISAATFGAMSLWGYTTKRDLTGMGSFLIMGLFGLIIASIVNIFLGSSALQFAISVIGVLIFAGLTAYDTQRIKELYYEADDVAVAGRKAIMGALTLYLDFINLFMFLLQFMGDRR